MTPAQALQLVLARWRDQWGSTTPYRLDNVEFRPDELVEGSPWVSLTFEVVAEGRQHTLGSRGQRQFRRRMILFIEIHVPSNTGTLQATLLLSSALTIFEGWRDGGLMAGEIIAPRQGNTGRDYVVVVEVPFTYYELK